MAGSFAVKKCLLTARARGLSGGWAGDSNAFPPEVPNVPRATSLQQPLLISPPSLPRACGHIRTQFLHSGTSYDPRMRPLAAWKHAGPLLPRSALHTSLGSLLRRSSPRCSRGLHSVPSLTGASWAGSPGSILGAGWGGWQRRSEERPPRRRALNPGTRAGSQLEAELGLRAHSLSIWSSAWQVSDASLYGLHSGVRNGAALCEAGVAGCFRMAFLTRRLDLARSTSEAAHASA